MLRRITNKSNLFRFQHCSCSFSSKPDYDVLIVGGGVVGQSVAAGLISSPNTSSLKIGIIDTQPAISIEDATINASSQPDLRVYALAPASINYLKDIGVWKHIESSNRSQPYLGKVYSVMYVLLYDNMHYYMIIRLIIYYSHFTTTSTTIITLSLHTLHHY